MGWRSSSGAEIVLKFMSDRRGCQPPIVMSILSTIANFTFVLRHVVKPLDSGFDEGAQTNLPRILIT